jgi:hypothetical protein
MKDRVWVIEVKTGLCLRVLAQAERWKPYANWRYIAIPSRRIHHEDMQLAKKVCEYLGIGIISVPKHSGKPLSIVKSTLSRKARSKEIVSRLHPEHKTYAMAGSPTGKRWTGFKATSKNVIDYITTHPNCTVAEIVENIDTHYKKKDTAKSCILEYIQKDIIPGVQVDRSGRALKFSMRPF